MVFWLADFGEVDNALKDGEKFLSSPFGHLDGVGLLRSMREAEDRNIILELQRLVLGLLDIAVARSEDGSQYCYPFSIDSTDLRSRPISTPSGC